MSDLVYAADAWKSWSSLTEGGRKLRAAKAIQQGDVEDLWLMTLAYLQFKGRNFPVVCLDEASKELRSTPRGSKPATLGQAAREDYEYSRHGTANVFLAVEPLAGRRTVRVTERRTNVDFAEELKRIVEQDYCHAEKVVLVTDNLNTHTVNALYEAFEPEVARRIARRVEWHYTPEHASWLNIAEIELAALGTQCLNQRIASKDDLERQITAWQAGVTPI